MKTVYKVNVIESERGWGQKVDAVRFFSTEEKAKTYCREFNKDNTLDHTPDWYMVAEYVGATKIPDTNEIF